MAKCFARLDDLFTSGTPRVRVRIHHDQTNWYFFVSSEETKPATKQATRKISQQAPGTPQSGHGVNPNSAYINVACNPGFHSDDEEGGFDEAAV